MDVLYGNLFTVRVFVVLITKQCCQAGTSLFHEDELRNVYVLIRVLCFAFDAALKDLVKTPV